MTKTKERYLRKKRGALRRNKITHIRKDIGNSKPFNYIFSQVEKYLLR